MYIHIYIYTVRWLSYNDLRGLRPNIPGYRALQKMRRQDNTVRSYPFILPCLALSPSPAPPCPPSFLPSANGARPRTRLLVLPLLSIPPFVRCFVFYFRASQRRGHCSSRRKSNERLSARWLRLLAKNLSVSPREGVSVSWNVLCRHTPN